MVPTHPPLLLVEDSPEDRVATMRAFKKAGLVNPIYCCANGDEALDFLYRRGSYTDPGLAPRPGVILLDLNMPGTDGREVLNDIKNNEDLKTIPVIVLTTSSDARDIQSCYQSGANSYVTKPVDLAGFFQAIERLKNWWFEVIVLPETR
ncbi:MAG: rcp1 [Planctomycetaceae bacterium]|nr:rcp1 [Planctomycetaceae bacterium]